MGLFKSVGNALGKVAKVALPIVGGLTAGSSTLWGKGLNSLSSAFGVQQQQEREQQNTEVAFQRNAAEAALQRQWASQEAATARSFNAEQASAQMAFQSASNAKQMDFQERMANSAHQREVADLRAAGLNPILSGTGGMGSATPVGSTSAGSAAHASAPSGSAATAPKASALDLVAPVIASALEVARNRSQVDLLDAQARNTEKNTEKQGAEIDVLKMQPEEIRARAGQLTADAALKESLKWKTEKEKDLMDSQIAELASRIKMQAAQAGLAGSQAGKVGEETRQLETQRFISKQIVDLKQDDMKGILADIPVDIVKGVLLRLFGNR